MYRYIQPIATPHTINESSNLNHNSFAIFCYIIYTTKRNAGGWRCVGLVPIASYILISVIIVSPNLKHFPLLYCYLFSVFSCHSLFPSLPPYLFSLLSLLLSLPPSRSLHSLSLSLSLSLSSNLFPSTNLLHSNRVIDQVTVTRRLLTLAIAQQYFGCYLLPQLWYIHFTTHTHTHTYIKKLQVGRYHEVCITRFPCHHNK